MYDRVFQQIPMNTFPFTDEDWGRVRDASFKIVNATCADDEAIANSLFLDLQEVLHELSRTYGDHPVLLETEADFSPDLEHTLSLYARALALARRNELPVDSICLSYAQCLIESKRDLEEAKAILTLCHASVQAKGDEHAIQTHRELTAMLASTDRGNLS